MLVGLTLNSSMVLSSLGNVYLLRTTHFIPAASWSKTALIPIVWLKGKKAKKHGSFTLFKALVGAVQFLFDQSFRKVLNIDNKINI